MLMDCLTCLKHSTIDYELGCGFFLFGSFKQAYEFLVLFLFFSFGLKFLYSDWFPRNCIQFFCNLRGKSRELKHGFCPKNIPFVKSGQLKFLKRNPNKTEQIKENQNPYTDSDSDCDSNDDEGGEFEISVLKNLLKIERHIADFSRSELEKERSASATAAAEAMAMILRLQNEKSRIQMDYIQYRRLAEERQIHDREVIQSLQWLVWRHEQERDVVDKEVKLCGRKLNSEEMEGGFSSCDGGSVEGSDVLENGFCGSLDFSLSME